MLGIIIIHILHIQDMDQKRLSHLSSETQSEVVNLDGKLVPSNFKSCSFSYTKGQRIQTRAWWGIKPFLKVSTLGNKAGL